jgi:hypothetical protein
MDPAVTLPPSEGESAPSPFLPGTDIQFALDSTSIGYFKTCPRLYYYIMIEGWQSKDESVHLKFGILYHAALHNYDILRLENHDHEEAVFQVVRWLCDNREDYPDVSEAKPSIRAKSFESLLRTVVWYLDKYPRETDPAETVVLENGKPACELSFRLELDWGPQRHNPAEFGHSPGMEALDLVQPYLLCGHLDRIVNFQDNLFVMDRKTTTSALTAYYFDQWSPNNQMSLYSIAGQIVIGSPVRGVIIDAAEVKGENSRSAGYSEFARGFTFRTPDQNEEWLADLRVWTSAMEACATSGSWPMNEASCGNYGGCKFREVCSKSPSVRQNFLKSEFTRGEKWNPLRAR